MIITPVFLLNLSNPKVSDASIYEQMIYTLGSAQKTASLPKRSAAFSITNPGLPHLKALLNTHTKKRAFKSGDQAEGTEELKHRLKVSKSIRS